MEGTRHGKHKTSLTFQPVCRILNLFLHLLISVSRQFSWKLKQAIVEKRSSTDKNAYIIKGFHRGEESRFFARQLYHAAAAASSKKVIPQQIFPAHLPCPFLLTWP